MNDRGRRRQWLTRTPRPADRYVSASPRDVRAEVHVGDPASSRPDKSRFRKQLRGHARLAPRAGAHPDSGPMQYTKVGFFGQFRGHLQFEPTSGMESNMSPTEREQVRSRESLEAENARLRARLRALESRGSAIREEEEGPSGGDRRDVADRAQNIPSRLARGLTYSLVEGMQASVDVLNVFADQVFRSPRSSRRTADDSDRVDARQDRNSDLDTEPDLAEDTERRPADRAADVVADLASGIAKGINESLDIPRRAVKGFSDAYSDAEPQGHREEASVRETREFETRSVRRYATGGERVTRSRTQSERKTPTGTEVTTESESSSETKRDS
jgi:hypothetical protein